MHFFAASALLCAALTAACIGTPVSRFFLDDANKVNAMHTAVVPRIGGLALLVASALVVAFAMRTSPPSTLILVLLLCAFALALVSLWDDARSLPVVWRLGAHAAASLAFVVTLSAHPAGFPQFPLGLALLGVLLLMGIVWCANLYNFMDGANGLAGLMGLFGFGAYAVVIHDVPASEAASWVTVLSLALSGASLGFLVFNLPRGRIFMGDVGAVTLGYLGATLGITGIIEGWWPFWFPLVVFSTFWVDATYTLLRRALRGEAVWRAHREHIYHRLILVLGWSHLKTAIVYGGLMGASVIGALLLLRYDKSGLYWLGAWVITYAALLLIAEWRFTLRFQNNKQKTTIQLAKENQEAR